LRALEAWLRVLEAWLRALEAWLRALEAWLRALEAWPRGGTDGHMDVRTDERTKCPVFYRTSFLWSAAQKGPKQMFS